MTVLWSVTVILAIFLPVQVELCYLWCMGPIQNRHMPVMVELDSYVCSLTGGTDVDVPTEEPKCLVCLCCNTVYMAIPFKIRLYGDTQICPNVLWSLNWTKTKLNLQRHFFSFKAEVVAFKVLITLQCYKHVRTWPASVAVIFSYFNLLEVL